MQCSNKVKQLSLACHNYHDAYQAFVSATGNVINPAANGNYDRWSGLVFLLPFLEQTALYSRYTSETAGSPSNWAAPSTNPRGQIVDAFLCPSDGNSRTHLETEPVRTNYRMCAGDSPFSFGASSASAGDPDYMKVAWRRGCFGYRTWYNIASIGDGTSNTALFSERAVGAAMNGVLRIIEGGLDGLSIGPIWGGGGNESYIYDRSPCINTRNGSQYKNPFTGLSYPGGYSGTWGWNYTDGDFRYSIFHTVISPNGPACYYNGGSRAIGMFTPTSNHTGGVNAGFADGSVHFISETIDIGTAGGANRDGSSPSTYGVWGALGSRNGGESTSF
jgi:prepilin-type processing-associated H-X9-DG protein